MADTDDSQRPGGVREPAEEPDSAAAEAAKTPETLPTPTGDPVPPPPSPQYRDRSNGLMIFGVIQILLGLLAGLMVPFVALGAFLSRLAPGSSMRPGQLFSSVLSYVLIAVSLLTLGVGSVQMKRWARALTLVISWYWLITGILVTVLLTAALPVTMRSVLEAQHKTAGDASPLSAGVMAVVLTVIIVMAAFFLILVPAGFVIFYGRNDVAQTCVMRDPVERWTDRVPLPVLGATFVFVAQGLYSLNAAITTPLLPFFGRYVTGIAGSSGLLLFACFEIFLAILFYRRQIAGWWIAVVAAPIRLFSMAFTYAKADLMQAYSKMGLSERQMQVMNSNPFLRSHIVLWWTLISALLFFVFVLWLKRYFQQTHQPQLSMPVAS